MNPRGQTIEALVPIEMSRDHTNGRVVDGQFRGYEILVDSLDKSHITHLRAPYGLEDYISPDDLTMSEMLSRFDSFSALIDYQFALQRKKWKKNNA